jgi:hypothetical protein
VCVVVVVAGGGGGILIPYYDSEMYAMIYFVNNIACDANLAQLINKDLAAHPGVCGGFARPCLSGPSDDYSDQRSRCLLFLHCLLCGKPPGRRGHRAGV